MATSSSIVKQEIQKWIKANNDSDEATVSIELSKISDQHDKVDFLIGDDEEKFSLTVPKDYPNHNPKDKFFVFSEEDALSGEWMQQLNEFFERQANNNKPITISQFLTKAVEKYMELTGEEDDEDEEGEEEGEWEDDDGMDLGLDTTIKKDPKPAQSKEEAAIDEKEFLEIGSPTATMRLIKDLKALSKGKPQELGFRAFPALDARSGLENLYHWEVRLFGFEKGSEMAKDMEKYQKRSGKDYIQMELRFSKDYPFSPPFVRVVAPRFQFRTGHVTIGGSICMELLTNSGWNSTNDIESILIQIRAELLSGGARLDAGMDNNYQYSEHEAWDAFYRAARTHGWDVKGLSKDAFPQPK